MSKEYVEEQRDHVIKLIGEEKKLICEFVEVVNTRRGQSQCLIQAINYTKKHGARLIISQFDQIRRNAHCISNLKNSYVDFVSADLPCANTLTIDVFNKIAQHEQEVISKRTKEALEKKKQQGFQLGTPQNLTSQAKEKGIKTIKQRAFINENNQRALAEIEGLMYQNKTLQQIADSLNESGFRTAKGTLFQRVQVHRLINKINYK